MQLPRRRVTEILVIGLLAAGLALIGRANLQSTRRDSATLTCRSNMRAILHEAGLYAADMQIAEASLGVDQLLAAGVVTARLGRCPLSEGPGPDYVVTIRDGKAIAIVCAVAPDQHRYEPEPAER
jgi:hypothetical protein